MATAERAHWGSRLGFVLAAAGSAIGLGNIWKFPYITGENGGGWFVLIYLACIAVVGLPIMMAEIFIGRTAQCSPVGAFRTLSKTGSPWILSGWLGVVAAFVILSFYSVVAGWAMHYSWLSVTNAFAGLSAEEVTRVFKTGDAQNPGVLENASLNIFWHVLFMAITVAIVLGGVRHGVERCAKVLMPMLFVMMLVLVIRAAFTGGFGDALHFVFAPRNEDFRWGPAILEALGHSFFTLSLGMGAMITYGSYLRQNDDLVTTSITVSLLDTVIALMACLVIFPIIFNAGMEPGQGPGLAFVSLPIAFLKLPAPMIWSATFFILLTFAALTSAISLLEVAVSYFIDERKWKRSTAAIACGAAILLLGIPSAISYGMPEFGNRVASWTAPFVTRFGKEEGLNWFDFFDYFSANWMLPLGGLFIALFVAWRVGDKAREQGFKAGTTFGRMYWGWLMLLRYIVPIAVLFVFLNLIGVFDRLDWFQESVEPIAPNDVAD